MNWRLNIFWKEAIVFLFVQAIGLVVAWQLLPALEVSAGVSIPIWLFAVYLALLIALFYFVVKLFRGPVFFQLFFALMVFIGANVVFQSLGLGENAALLAVTVVVLRLIYPNVWTHNIAIVLALAGIGAAFGVGVSVIGVIIILIALSIYDVWAVYQTNYLVKMFKGLVANGVILSIVVPENFRDWTEPLHELRIGPGTGVVILGTGDMVLPLIFAAAALPQSTWLSVGSILGGTLGLLGVHVWLLALKKKRALPALPPIALGLFIGYALTWSILAAIGIL